LFIKDISFSFKWRNFHLPTQKLLSAVVTSHWIIKSSGYPIFENYLWTKASGFSSKTDVKTYKNPFLGRTYSIPRATRTIQPIVLSVEMYYEQLEKLREAWNTYKNQPITITQNADLCSDKGKQVKFTGCIWIGLDDSMADRAQNNLSQVICTFSVVRAD
jgi:hypothetical protein